MNNRHRFAALVSAIILACVAGMPMAVADKVSDDQIRKAQTEEKRAAKSVADIEVALASLTAEAHDLELALAQAEVANSQAHSKLRDTMDAAEEAQICAEEAQAKVEEGRATLGRIGAAFYREGAGSLSEINYFFDATSLQEVSDKSRAYDIAGRNAKSALDEFQALQDVATALQKEAERLYQQQAREAEKAEAAMKAVDEQAQKTCVRIEEIEQERDKLITTLAAKQGVTRELVAAQRQQKEEEARQNAAAEAQRLRAAEQARLAAQAAQYNPAPAPVHVPVPAPVISSGNLGEQIVAYARQYKGVPYVWGGNTTSGWDCSGFTKYVYAHFGINLPRTTYGIEAAGYREVSRAELKPGDLVLWPGHVGIYTGNGQHIAARSSKKGTVEGPLYGTPHYVRVVNY